MKTKLRILMALLHKEILLMRYNPLVPRVIFMMPLAVMLVMPLVATFDVEHVGVAIVDTDNSALSRRIVSDMNASGWLEVDTVTAIYTAAMESVEQGTADVIVSLPRDVEKNSNVISVEANGVNATKGVLGAQYATQSVMKTITQWRREQGMNIVDNQPSVVNLFNPTQNYRFYMIPALMCMLIIVICGFLPGLNLVSEKESGTIDAMNVTPVGRLSFVLSKLIPFWIVGIIVMCVGIVIGKAVYGLTPQGSIGAILLASILFSLVMSGFGVAVANKSNTLMQTIFVMYAVVMVCQLIGGLFTPISSMPVWAQYITYAVPPRYFIDIMRAVYLKGSSISDLWFEYVMLTLLASFTCGLAAITYRKRA